MFRNHINFHHTHYADDHLVSWTYLGGEGNITPYFLIPVFLVGGCAYFLLPLNLFVVMVVASAASFYAHVFFNRESRRAIAPSKVCMVQTAAVRGFLRRLSISRNKKPRRFRCSLCYVGTRSKIRDVNSA